VLYSVVPEELKICTQPSGHAGFVGLGPERTIYCAPLSKD